MSSVQLDEKYTTAKHDGEAIAYQGQKKCKTSNMLTLPDVNGIQIAYSDPISGNNNDAYNLSDKYNEMVVALKKSKICIDRLFLNADTDLYSAEFRNCLFKHN